MKMKTAFLIASLIVSIAHAQSFIDVPPDHWGRSYLDSFQQSGYIDSAENFRPGDSVNRAEFSKMIVKVFDLSFETPQEQTFPDVSGDAWYYSYVETVAANNIVSGYENGLFGPADHVTREQAAKMIVLGANLDLNTKCYPSFVDSDLDRWSVYYIETLYANGITNGYDNYTYIPTKPINRIEIVKLLSDALVPSLRVCAREVKPDLHCISRNLAAKGIGKGATNIILLSLECSAYNKAVTVSSMEFRHFGAGHPRDIENVYLYEKTNRLTGGRLINSETQKVSFPNLNATIKENETMFITLVVDFSREALSATQHGFELLNKESIVSDAETVEDNFPIRSRFVTVSVF